MSTPNSVAMMPPSFLDRIFETARSPQEAIQSLAEDPHFVQAVSEGVIAENYARQARTEDEAEGVHRMGGGPGQAGRSKFIEAISTPTFGDN